MLVGLDVEDELQQAERDQQRHPSGSVGLGQVAPGPQPTGVHPPRRLPGPHFPAAPAAGRQPASAAASSYLRHIHSNGPLPHLHSEAPLPVRQRANVNTLQAGGHHASAGEPVPPWEPMDMRLQHEVAP